MRNSYFFIINPVSLRGGNSTEQKIRTFFSTRDELIEICYWNAKNEVADLVQKGIHLGYSCIVACGGDGTILQVGRALLNTHIALGILPLGSGNGIARHFNISTHINKALESLVKYKTQPMDIGKAGDHYFFSNIGFGIEVDFIKAYQEKRIHGIKGYVLAFIRALFNFEYRPMKLQHNNKTSALNPCVFLIANTNEQGYGISLTPMAKTNDGKLNLIVVPKLSLVQLFYFGLCVLRGKPIPPHKKILHLKGDYFKLQSTTKGLAFQIDGEYVFLDENQLEISVLPHAIEVIGSANE